MARGPKAASMPFTMETIIDRNMNRALTSSALPTFTDMTLMFKINLSSKINPEFIKIHFKNCSSEIRAAFLFRLALFQLFYLGAEKLHASPEVGVLLGDLGEGVVERGKLVVPVEAVGVAFA